MEKVRKIYTPQSWAKQILGMKILSAIGSFFVVGLSMSILISFFWFIAAGPTMEELMNMTFVVCVIAGIIVSLYIALLPSVTFTIPLGSGGVKFVGGKMDESVETTEGTFKTAQVSLLGGSYAVSIRRYPKFKFPLNLAFNGMLKDPYLQDPAEKKRDLDRLKKLEDDLDKNKSLKPKERLKLIKDIGLARKEIREADARLRSIRGYGVLSLIVETTHGGNYLKMSEFKPEMSSSNVEESLSGVAAYLEDFLLEPLTNTLARITAPKYIGDSTPNGNSDEESFLTILIEEIKQATAGDIAHAKCELHEYTDKKGVKCAKLKHIDFPEFGFKITNTYLKTRSLEEDIEAEMKKFTVKMIEVDITLQKGRIVDTLLRSFEDENGKMRIDINADQLLVMMDEYATESLEKKIHSFEGLKDLAGFTPFLGLNLTDDDKDLLVKMLKEYANLKGKK